jgi:hypothetical protein
MRERTSTSKTPDTQPAAMHEPDADVSSEDRLSRRHFLTSSAAGVVAGAITSETLAGTALAANRKAKSSGPGDSRGGRILLKGGCVLSLDASVGDFETADVLIEGSKIVAVQPNLKASAAVIDASNMIVMPGFVDTHRHIWEGQLRNILPNGLLSDYQRCSTGHILATVPSTPTPPLRACGSPASAPSTPMTLGQPGQPINFRRTSVGCGRSTFLRMTSC